MVYKARNIIDFIEDLIDSSCTILEIILLVEEETNEKESSYIYFL